MLFGAALSLVLLMTAMAGAAWLAERTRLSGFIDGIWSLATGVAALVLIMTVDDEHGARAGLVAALITVWAVRLGRHLVTRTLGSRSDDPRYADLRREWGEAAPRRMFVFLEYQAVAGWLLAISAAAATMRSGPLGFQDAIGVAVAMIALIGERHADRTLSAFRRERPGEVCDVGLWGWTRHPNYFFEWLFWVGLAVIGLSGLDVASALSLIAPVVMYLLLVHVSGIPPLERHMLKSRGAAFAAYQQRVPPFFPRPPRRGQADSQRDSAR